MSETDRQQSASTSAGDSVGEQHRQLWQDREKHIITALTRVADVNFRTAMTYKYWHLSCSVLVMICAVLAPLFIASSSSSALENSFGLSPATLTKISLALTVLLGVTEGLRRIFRFEQRWFSYYTASNALVQIRERYLNASLELQCGTPEWKDLFLNFHKDAQSVFNEQNKMFFQGVLEHSDLSAGSSSSNPAKTV